jgi:hypothetical protein
VREKLRSRSLFQSFLYNAELRNTSKHATPLASTWLPCATAMAEIPVTPASLRTLAASLSSQSCVSHTFELIHYSNRKLCCFFSSNLCMIACVLGTNFAWISS